MGFWNIWGVDFCLGSSDPTVVTVKRDGTGAVRRFEISPTDEGGLSVREIKDGDADGEA